MKRFVFGILVIFAVAAAAAPEVRAQRSRSYTIESAGGGTKLGVSLQDVTAKLKDAEKLSVSEGAYVADVYDRSPADKAGIEEGDVIVSFDGRTIREADDLVRAVKRAPTGEPVTVVLDRKGEKKTLSVKLRKRAGAFSWSDGGRRLSVVPPVPPFAPRSFHFNIRTSQTIEGMEVQPLSKQLAEYFEAPGGRGLLVTDVEKRSAAADAGIKAGDVIVKVNSSAVRSVEDLREELDDAKDATAQLEILRRGKSQTVTLKVEVEDDDDSAEEDEDVSFDLSVPSVPHIDHSGMRRGISEANKDFLRELHETLNLMQDRIREKMERLQEQITDNVLNM